MKRRAFRVLERFAPLPHSPACHASWCGEISFSSATARPSFQTLQSRMHSTGETVALGEGGSCGADAFDMPRTGDAELFASLDRRGLERVERLGRSAAVSRRSFSETTQTAD